MKPEGVPRSLERKLDFCCLAIEFRHLRYFIAASEHRSFRKTGEALGVQESTISRAIRDLEDRLGASLFHRHTGGARLTAAGEQFLQRVRMGLQHIGEGIRDVGEIGRNNSGCISVGIFSSLASGFLAELLQKFGRSHPDVMMDLVDGNPADHTSAVRLGKLDVAFITGTSKQSDCELETFWCEKVFVVLPEGHELTRKASLKWSDLASERFVVSVGPPGPEIHDYLVQRLAGLGHHPEVHPQYVSRDNLLSLVALGRGLTLTSEATTVTRIPNVVYRPVVDELLPFSAVWSLRNDNPALRRLLSMARLMSKTAAS